MQLSLSFLRSLASTDSFDKKLWRELERSDKGGCRECEAKEEENDMSGTLEIAGKTGNSAGVCVCGKVSCILLKLIFLAANALVPSILLLLYVVAALLCLSHLRSLFFLPVRVWPISSQRGMLHSQMIGI